MKFFRFFTFNVVILLFHDVMLGEDLIVTAKPKDTLIRVMRLDESKVVELGRSPVEIDQKKVTRSLLDSPSFILELSYPGYETKRFVISRTSNVDIRLSPVLRPIENLEMMRKIDQLVASLFEAQRTIRSLNFDDAIEILNEQENIFPYVSTIPELKGSLYYMKNAYIKSLEQYQKAVKINPENLDAYQMKNVLEKSLGSK